MTYTPPRHLTAIPSSPRFDKEALEKIDRVLVDGVHLPECVAYDMDAGWAFNKIDGLWQPRKYGVITVTVKS